MTTQTRSARRVAASQGAASKSAPTVVTAFVNSVLSAEGAIAETRSAFEGARVTALQVIAPTLQGLPFVTESDWETQWKEPVAAALKASGRYAEKSIPPKVSALKVIVMGITHGDFTPGAGDTLKSYETTVRKELQAKGVLSASKSGAKKQSEADKTAKLAKKAQAEFVTACEVATLHNATMADHLALVMADPDARKELATLLAEMAEEIRAKDAEESKASRRRKA